MTEPGPQSWSGWATWAEQYDQEPQHGEADASAAAGEPSGPPARQPDFQGVQRPAPAWLPAVEQFPPPDPTQVLPAVEQFPPPDPTQVLPVVTDYPAPVPPGALGATAWPPADEEPRISGEQVWAVLAHLSAIPAFWVGPLLVLLAKGRSERVRAEAIAALNWEITVALLLALSVFLVRFGTVGPALAISVLILSVILHLIGAITVATGRSFRYPLAVPIVR